MRSAHAQQHSIRMRRTGVAYLLQPMMPASDLEPLDQKRLHHSEALRVLPFFQPIQDKRRRQSSSGSRAWCRARTGRCGRGRQACSTRGSRPSSERQSRWSGKRRRLRYLSGSPHRGTKTAAAKLKSQTELVRRLIEIGFGAPPLNHYLADPSSGFSGVKVLKAL